MRKNRKHIRLMNWDYSSEGIYFITICTRNKEPFFGKIHDHKVILSEIGLFAQKFWNEIPQHFPHVYLDEFVVMPDHVHGLLILDYSHAGPQDMTNPQIKNINQFSKPVKNSVSVIINHYKSSVTRCCKQNNFELFCWQPKFYDHIIRSKKALYNIRKYIIKNPEKWDVYDVFV